MKESLNSISSRNVKPVILSVLAKELASTRIARSFASTLRVTLVAMTLALAILGCDDMRNQSRYEPLEASEFFADGQSARPGVAGTVARGQLRDDDALFAGRVDGQLVETFPFELTRADLDRGRQRFDIYCAVCHGYTGDGNGMIVQRGFARPPSLHLDRLRNAPAGHFYEVITNGWGAMYSYASRIPVEDRWRIVGYVRALQLSQNADVASLPASDQQEFHRGQTPAPTTNERAQHP